jgi:regulator of sigma E protease
VLLAGPGANFLFAILAYWILFMQGVPGLKPVIGEVVPDSHAAHADLRTLDEIVGIAGKPTPTRQAAILSILEHVVEDGAVPLEVRDERGATRNLTIRVPEGERRALTEPGVLLRGLGLSFWYPPQPVVVAELSPGDPAIRAGLAIGDRIVAVDGMPVADYPVFVAEIRSRPERPTRITAIRDGRRIDLDLVPKAVVEEGRTVGKIGLGAALGDGSGFPTSMQTVERYGPFTALAPAVRETWDKSALTLRFLWRMVTGHVSTKNISGPINIAQYAGLTATEGFTYYLGFLALVSISLAVLNLLPVPVLDGGQVMFQLVEMVKGAPLSMKAQVFGQKVGIAMLVALMSVAFYNDITRLFG